MAVVARWTVLIMLAAGAARGDGFVLVSRGRAASQIVTGEGAPETVGFAAGELRTYVRKMSGAELPIVSEAVPRVPAIRLGPAARAVLPAADLEGIRRDGYLITVCKGDLCVVGIDDAGPHTDIEALLAKGQTHSMPTWDFNRGTLYGVYRLLEALGVRWFLPGEFGERARRVATLEFSGSFRENPHFVSRMVGYWSMWVGINFRKDIKGLTIMPGERAAIGFTPAENRMWELRMRGATYQVPLNHYPPRARWSGRFGETHPEYFALLPDGTRCTKDQHLCYTCAGVVDESVADIRAYAAGLDSEARGISRIHPITGRSRHDDNRGWPPETAYGDVFSLLPNDGFRACGCPGCAEQIASGGAKGERHSRLVWDYVGRCAEKVPGRKVSCLAYGTYALPYPGMKPLPPNVVVGYCAFTHPASLYYKDTFDQYEKAVRRWATLAHGNLAFWQHYLASNRNEETVGMPEHTPRVYARAVRTMAKYGNHAFCEMLATSIMFELFNRYLLLKLFYDPTLDEQTILDDFIARFYGPEAGPLIGQVYADINSKCIERFRNRYAACGVWEKLFNERVLGGYTVKTNRALQKARGTEYERAVAAFRDFYLGAMECGRARYAQPLAYLLAPYNAELVSRPIAATVAIDGKLDEAAWESAAPVTMGNTVNGKVPSEATEVRVCHNADYLYFAVNAAAPDVASRSVRTGEPGAVDGVEILLDVPRTRRNYRRIGIDLTGGIHGCQVTPGSEPPRREWDSRATAAVALGEARYTMEVAIPRRALLPANEESPTREWGVLVGRTVTQPRRTCDRQSSTSRLLRGDLEQPAFFNALTFAGK